MMHKSSSIRSFEVLVCLCLAVMASVLMLPTALGFGSPKVTTVVLVNVNRGTTTMRSPLFPPPPTHSAATHLVSIAMRASSGDNNDGDTNTNTNTNTNTDLAPFGDSSNSNDDVVQDNFDGEGFAKYLLPYAVALIGSVVATAALFKFVLLDY
eukprot:jgi/Psemu1/10255/gm1.10255_g